MACIARNRHGANNNNKSSREFVLVKFLFCKFPSYSPPPSPTYFLLLPGLLCALMHFDNFCPLFFFLFFFHPRECPTKCAVSIMHLKKNKKISVHFIEG